MNFEVSITLKSALLFAVAIAIVLPVAYYFYLGYHAFHPIASPMESQSFGALAIVLQGSGDSEGVRNWS
ncbi:MAG: hypothetical protein GXP16_06255 [Gammaproteobacteria bacterium]|nr:hypothetical protein [Gammaproteobacteria bacterium]